MNSFSGTARLIKPRHLLLVFLVLAVLMVSSAVIELNQSKKELLDLLTEQAHTLSETVIAASRNTLMTNMVLEDLIEERLLNHATLIGKFYRNRQVSNRFLEEYARDNHLYRINILGRDGRKIFTSHQQSHFNYPSGTDPEDILIPIFEGETDTLILGLKAARYEEGYRFAVAVAAPDRSAIVVNLDAEQLLEFRRQIGFGSLLQNLVENPGMVYAALQDTSGILAASGNVEELERIMGSPFLQGVLRGPALQTRIAEFNTRKVFEAVQPFVYEAETIGLLRIGLSMEPLNTINARIYRRISFISLILLLVGFILFTLLMVLQNLDLTRRQYQAVETYSRNIIQNVSDAIIVHEIPGGIKIFNETAEKLFTKSAQQVVGKGLETVSDRIDWTSVLKDRGDHSRKYRLRLMTGSVTC